MQKKILSEKVMFIGSLLTMMLIMAFTGKTQSLNIKGGLNMSKINFFDDDGVRYYFDEAFTFTSGDYAYINTYKEKKVCGATAGISFENKTKKRVCFEMGLNYTQRGFSYESNSEETYNGIKWLSEQISELKIHYVDIPLTMKFNFYNEGVRLYGNFGLFAGIAMLGKETYRSSVSYDEVVETYTEEEDFDIKDVKMRVNSGLSAGLGIEYKNIFLESNYSAGLMNIQEVDDEVYISKDLSITVGYKFQFTKKE